MSASAIADALVTLLSAPSAFGDAVSKNSYKVLESASMAAVVGWSSLTSRAEVFGDPRLRTREWTMQVDIFVKDTGDPGTVLVNTLAAIDSAVDAIESDDTLQGTAEVTGLITATREPGEAVTYGGATWLPVQIKIDATEWPGG